MSKSKITEKPAAKPKRRTSKFDRQMGVIPESGFMRLEQVLSVIPVVPSQWWAGIQSGIYPPGVKLGVRTTAWPASSIAELCDLLAEGKTWEDRVEPDAKAVA